MADTCVSSVQLAREPIPQAGASPEGSSERDVPLRLHLSISGAQLTAARLLAERGLPSAVALRDLLWLRAVLIEQWRRTPVLERRRFERRADRILEHCWAGAGSLDPSDATDSVERNEKP